jgi:two-component system, sensor histidine kinase PdtaS
MILTPRRLFIVLGVLSAVAVIGFRGQSLLSERKRLLEQREAQVATQAQLIATYTARLYDSSGRIAHDVAAKIRNEHPSPAALRAYLAERASSTTVDDYVVYTGPDGSIIAMSEPAPNAGMNVSGRPGFEEHREGVERRVGTMTRSPVTGAVVYPLSDRLEDAQGRFAGTVGVAIRPTNVRQTAQRGPADPQLSIWTLDGRFVAATFVDFDTGGQAIPPPRPAGVGLPGAAATKDRGQITAAAPVDGWPLIAVASYDKKGVLAAWRLDLLENSVLILLVLAGVGALVWFGTRTADREEAAKQGFREASNVAAAALRDRELLLKEVHHRVKNSLLMTSSLIHLQGRQFEDEKVRGAFESTRQRLTSIGLVHEALYSGVDLAVVDLAVYLPKLVHEIAHAHGADERGVRMNIQIDSIQLSPEQATPVGLIVAEVVTNAFKHAFGPGGAGEIIIRGGIWPGDEVEVTVHDDGTGYPAAGEPGGGLGTRLIRALTEQLGGRLSFTSQGGAMFRLTFPRTGPQKPAESLADEPSAPAA